MTTTFKFHDTNLLYLHFQQLHEELCGCSQCRTLFSATLISMCL